MAASSRWWRPKRRPPLPSPSAGRQRTRRTNAPSSPTGENHYRRARVLAEAGRFDEALPEAECAIAAHDDGGERGELPRAEAVRIAALIEGNGLDRAGEAVIRLTAASARCRQAGHPEAAHVLDTLRQDLRTG
ncbi:hypothetical protein ABZ572_38290 [Streptomyces sp. NPDC018338]|uniref:hypothetical protein n=1 Tax=Streptomyces sp. NPDC018338 TaxID=3157192 RepID=UPI0033E92B52